MGLGMGPGPRPRALGIGLFPMGSPFALRGIGLYPWAYSLGPGPWPRALDLRGIQPEPRLGALVFKAYSLGPGPRLIN